MALAVLGIVGGFAAPILTSTGGGSHVMLFAYYAVLNAGIFAIAWFKAWRLLNVVGFACTFIVGTLWGVTRYRPEDFATTEPFLILFFLFYVGIATLYALRRSLEVRRYVDATLVFGTPLVAAGLQGALVRHDRVRDGVERLGRIGPSTSRSRACFTRAIATTCGCSSRRSWRSASCSRRSPFRSRSMRASRPRRGRSKVPRWSGSACGSSDSGRARSVCCCRWRRASRSDSDSASGPTASSAARCPS